MEIIGTVIKVLQPVTGTSAKGPWKKQEYVIQTQTQSQYPKSVCFTLWGENIDKFAIREGEEIRVAIDLESREYNGRWYTEVKAWKVDRTGGQQQQNQPAGMMNTSFQQDKPVDDLPF